MGKPAYQPQPAGANGLAVASLVLGILSICAGCLTGIPAIILGHFALSQIRQTGAGGAGMAKWGLGLGYVTTILALLFMVLYALFGAALLTAGGGGEGQPFIYQ
jgi:peptidyl-prolyl cis-trans isomerase B (cyclophilin B)